MSKFSTLSIALLSISILGALVCRGQHDSVLKLKDVQYSILSALILLNKEDVGIEEITFVPSSYKEGSSNEIGRDQNISLAESLIINYIHENLVGIGKYYIYSRYFGGFYIYIAKQESEPSDVSDGFATLWRQDTFKFDLEISEADNFENQKLPTGQHRVLYVSVFPGLDQENRVFLTSKLPDRVFFYSHEFASEASTSLQRMLRFHGVESDELPGDTFKIVIDNSNPKTSLSQHLFYLGKYYGQNEEFLYYLNSYSFDVINFSRDKTSLPIIGVTAPYSFAIIFLLFSSIGIQSKLYLLSFDLTKERSVFGVNPIVSIAVMVCSCLPAIATLSPLAISASITAYGDVNHSNTLDLLVFLSVCSTIILSPRIVIRSIFFTSQTEKEGPRP